MYEDYDYIQDSDNYLICFKLMHLDVNKTSCKDTMQFDFYLLLRPLRTRMLPGVSFEQAKLAPISLEQRYRIHDVCGPRFIIRN